MKQSILVHVKRVIIFAGMFCCALFAGYKQKSVGAEQAIVRPEALRGQFKELLDTVSRKALSVDATMKASVKDKVSTVLMSFCSWGELGQILSIKDSFPRLGLAYLDAAILSIDDLGRQVRPDAQELFKDIYGGLYALRYAAESAIKADGNAICVTNGGVNTENKQVVELCSKLMDDAEMFIIMQDVTLLPYLEQFSTYLQKTIPQRLSVSEIGKLTNFVSGDVFTKVKGHSDDFVKAVGPLLSSQIPKKDELIHQFNTIFYSLVACLKQGTL